MEIGQTKFEPSHLLTGEIRHQVDSVCTQATLLYHLRVAFNTCPRVYDPPAHRGLRADYGDVCPLCLPYASAHFWMQTHAVTENPYKVSACVAHDSTHFDVGSAMQCSQQSVRFQVLELWTLLALIIRSVHWLTENTRSLRYCGKAICNSGESLMTNRERNIFLAQSAFAIRLTDLVQHN